MLKNIIKKIFLHYGPLSVFRIVMRLRSGPGITILYGHRVLPDEIIACKTDPHYIAGDTSVSEVIKAIQVLSKHYMFITIDEAVAQIKSGKVKRDSVVVTFDDGFQDNFAYLLPVLKEYNVPAIFYINPSVIGTDDSLWFQAIINYFFSQKEKRLYVETNGKEYDITTAQNKFNSAFHFMRYLQANHAPSEFIPIISALSGGDCKPSLLDKHMTWEELECLSKEPLVVIGAHGVNHYPLSLCEHSLAAAEIINSKTKLEERLNIEVKHFSYPRGHVEDFNINHVNVLKDSGISSAVTTIRGVNRKGQNIFCLKRVGFPQKVNGATDELLWYVAGITQLIASIKLWYCRN